MECPAPLSGVIESPAVQEEEWVWILRSLASILARTSAAWLGWMEWPAPLSGVIESPAVQEEEWVWILRSLASILARPSAAWLGWIRPARSLCGGRGDGRC